MNKYYPHEYFKLEFDQILEEGQRQEEIHPANGDELEIVERIHSYITNVVFYEIIQNDWVYAAATTFAEKFVKDCFRNMKLVGEENYKAQKRLHKNNDKITDFIALANSVGAVPFSGIKDLEKGSDFLNLIEFEKLSLEMKGEATKLLKEAKDIEDLHIYITLRSIRNNYEIILPRVMYVIRRIIKVQSDLSPTENDETLPGISEYLDWYAQRINEDHPFHPVTSKFRSFYKVARNVGSHHEGLSWIPEKEQVILKDKNTTLEVHMHEFLQRHRHLIYLCEYGTLGILSAFCEREKNGISNMLVEEYRRIFPADFPPGEEGLLKRY